MEWSISPLLCQRPHLRRLAGAGGGAGGAGGAGSGGVRAAYIQQALSIERRLGTLQVRLRCGRHSGGGGQRRKGFTRTASRIDLSVFVEWVRAPKVWAWCGCGVVHAHFHRGSTWFAAWWGNRLPGCCCCILPPFPPTPSSLLIKRHAPGIS
ncbi:hypothetical protein E2C01_000183 [Portunus trituberculatus]|uniref:Uncharacterized protein n=1 Tax=Portunus trituberculatus TaxID=210409 RepID=A0A5B7CDM4_PORTR|nr:hypothetical protein [Portunus trituberculatus]